MIEIETKLKSYKFRLKPTAEQKVYFAKTFGCARAIWNMMLSDFERMSLEQVFKPIFTRFIGVENRRLN